MVWDSQDYDRVIRSATARTMIDGRDHNSRPVAAASNCRYNLHVCSRESAFATPTKVVCTVRGDNFAFDVA